MKRWTPKQVIAVVLGVMFALGTVISTAQAAEMAAEMSTGAAIGSAAGQDGCGGPCGGDDATASAGPCVVVCPNSVLALVPPVGPSVSDAVAARRLTDFASASRSSHPDPHPPKTSFLI